MLRRQHHQAQRHQQQPCWTVLRLMKELMDHDFIEI
jgi:hypothetical protein